MWLLDFEHPLSFRSHFSHNYTKILCFQMPDFLLSQKVQNKVD